MFFFSFLSVPARYGKALLELLRKLYPDDYKESDHVIVCLPYLFHFCFFFQRVILGAKHNVRRRRKTAQRNHAKRTKRLPLPQKWTRFFFCKKTQHSFKVCPERKDWLDSRRGKSYGVILQVSVSTIYLFVFLICMSLLVAYFGCILYICACSSVFPDFQNIFLISFGKIFCVFHI